MKKIKTINKLLSSLTLLSPLVGIGFNNQYQNTQKVITENNCILNSYFNSVGDQRTMGNITVNVEGTAITGYVSGTGDLVLDSDITEIADGSFQGNKSITSLDLSNATSLTTIGNSAFYYAGISSLDLSQATSLTTIGNSAFSNCRNLTGDLVIPSSLTTIGNQSFKNTNFTSLTIDSLNKNFSLASNLGPDAYVLLSGTEGIWKDESAPAGSLACGDIVFPSNITTIKANVFKNTKITSLDLSQATSLTTIGDSSFYDCENLTGNLVIPSSVTSIENYAFIATKITSLDLSHATSLISIDSNAFEGLSNLTGDLVIPSNVTVIGAAAFRNTTFDNLFFISETPPSFDVSWNPTITGKVYVPSQAAKEAYLSAPNFGFTEDQIEVIEVIGKVSIDIEEKTTGSEQYTSVQGFNPTKWEIVMTEGEQPEWLSVNKQGLLSWTSGCVIGTYKFKIKATNDSQTSIESAPITFVVNESIKPEPKTLNIPLILGLLILLGIPVILAIAFIIWYLTKKREIEVKIKKKK